jgi:flagellar hook protein FlgE
MHHDTPTDYSTTGVGGAGLDLDTELTDISGVGAGEQILFTVGAGSYTYTVTSTGTVQDLINAINTNLSDYGLAELVDGEVRIVAKQLSISVTVADVGAGNAAASLGFTNAAAPTAPDLLLTASGTYNPNGWWQVNVKNAATGESLEKGSINFNSDGTINAERDTDDEIKFAIDNINWANGSALQDVNVVIGNITQFAGTYNVISTTQDGAELGLRTGIEIDRLGKVIARFSNGQTSAIYQLPLATFTSPNGLTEVTGNAYSQTVDSGSFNLKQAGTGGAGLIEGSALESSNVDIADEFTKMIVIQRAYSAGTKVIRTVDEMTEELLRLR